MSNERRSKGRPFVKGQPSANPGGRPKLPPDVIQAAQLNVVEAKRILNRLINMTFNELKEFLGNPQNSVHELMVARAIAEAIKNGDKSTVEWLYQRLIGKIPDTLDLNVTHSVHDKIIEFQRKRQELMPAPEIKDVTPEIVDNKKDEPS